MSLRRASFSVRGRAASVIALWEGAPAHERPPLGRLTEEFSVRAGTLSARDRALLHELVFGVVRWLSLLDRHINAQLSEKSGKLSPIVRAHLRVGAYQLLFLDRIPPSAAVNEAVKCIKETKQARASGLVNAVLRRIADRRERFGLEGARRLGGEGPSDFCERIAVKTAHPLWMVRRWHVRLGPEKTAALCDADNTMAPLTLRVQPPVMQREALLGRFSDAGVRARAGRFSPDAVIVDDFSGSPTSLPGFGEGWFQVQDEAAQLVSYCLAPRAGEVILDAFAGVGGKTTHIARLMKDSGTIEATDISASRLGLLDENLKRLNIRSVAAIPHAIFRKRMDDLKGRYHRILADAPCSGLGVIRRHPDIKWNRTPGSIPELAARQEALLAMLAPLLRPGGVMVYAVCTTEPEETTGVVEAFLVRHGGWNLISARQFLPGPARSLVNRSGCLETMPEPGGPDGFFAAILGRKGS